MASGGVAGVVLAAGPSQRFRSEIPKQVQPFAGEPLVRRISRRALASRLTEVVVVVGNRSDLVRKALGDLAVGVVENPGFAAGQSSSVRVGLAAIDPGAAAAMFLPVDQPFLTTEVIDRLVGVWEGTGGPIVVPVHQGRRGAPAVIGRSLFGELAGISGDEGGRQLFARHGGEIVEVSLSSPKPLLDIDSLEDLERLS